MSSIHKINIASVLTKILCCFIATALVLCDSVCSLAAKQSVYIAYNVKEDFELTSVGSRPSAFSATTNGNSISVQNVPCYSTKSLLYDITSKNDAYTDVYVPALSKNVIIEFDIMFAREADAKTAVYFKNKDYKEFTLLQFDGSLNLNFGGVKVQKCVPGRYYRICASVDVASGLADIYVDRKRRSSDVKISSADIKNINMIRFHSLGIGDGEKPRFVIDNVAVYESEYPAFKYEEMGVDVVAVKKNSSGIASDKDVNLYMGDATAVYINKSKIYSEGRIWNLDDSDPAAKTYSENGTAYIPLQTVREHFGADGLYDGVSGKITLNFDTAKLQMQIEDTSYTLNGQQMTMQNPPKSKDGNVYVPVRVISDALGKKITYDKCGLIVIADRENFFNFIDDLSVFRGLCQNLVFENPTGEEMVNLIKSNHPDNSHPRIYADKQKLEILKNRIQTDSYCKKWFVNVKTEADTTLKEAPAEYDIYDGIRLLDISRLAKTRFENLAFTYRMTDDEKYAVRCIEEIKAVCNFKDWNPNHFLDTAEMMNGLAFAYDWLYDYLKQNNPDVLIMAKDALRDMGLKQVLDDYKDLPRSRTFKWSFGYDNWNLVCNSGALTAAMAIADEEEEICAEVFDYGMANIQKGILMYAPDGAWYEGTGYWHYATNFLVDFLSAMDSTFYTSFGYKDAPGMTNTGYFLSAMSSLQGGFNFHDSGLGLISSPELFYFADNFDDPGLASVRMELMNSLGWTGAVRDILWYNPDLAALSPKLSNDYYCRDTEVVSMRSNHHDDNGIFVAFHAGKTNVTHGHMDAGSFVLDGYGTRFAHDVGGENYNIPDSVWNLYRYRAEGHNTLVINPDKSGGQELSGVSRIDRFESGEGSAFAITDLSQMYVGNASSVKRGIKLMNNRSEILIQDEIKADTPADVWWFMHTTQPITVSPDGQSAIIQGTFKDMKLTVLDNSIGSFEVLSATPLPTSPTNDMQKKNQQYMRLAFHAPDVTDGTIPILIQFESPLSPKKVQNIEVVPLSNWTLDEENGAMPHLAGIKINDEEIDGFDRNKFSYTHKLKPGETSPVIVGESDCETVVKMPDQLPGNALLIAKENGLSTEYVVRLEYETASDAPQSHNKLQLAVASGFASNSSYVNTIDNDTSTYLQASYPSHIVYDIGDNSSIEYIGIKKQFTSIRNITGIGRKETFVVAVSDNGVEFENIYFGELTSANGYEYFRLPSVTGRYVRIEFRPHTFNASTRIQEIEMYGQTGGK